MKWNKKSDPKDMEIQVKTKFALFPKAVVVLSDRDNPLKIFLYGSKRTTTKYVWLETYQSVYQYIMYYGTPNRSY